MLGPLNAAWRALYFALADVAVRCSGAFAFVVDTSHNIWCLGAPKRRPATVYAELNACVATFCNVELPKRRVAVDGFCVARVDGVDRYVAMSLDGQLIAGVWFDSDEVPSEAAAKALLRRELPLISSLVNQLPPLGGGPTSGAASKRVA